MYSVNDLIVNNLPELNITETENGLYVQSEYLNLKMQVSNKTQEEAIKLFKDSMIDYYVVISARGPKTDKEVIMLSRLQEYVEIIS